MVQNTQISHITRTLQFNLCPSHYINSQGKTVAGNAATLHIISEVGGINALLSLAAELGYLLGQKDLMAKPKKQLYRLIG